MDNFKYSILIKYHEEDNDFIAVVPELSGLSAFGNTHDEAISELLTAGKAYLESLEDHGNKIPAPDTVKPYSGKINFRMPKSLHAKLAMMAENEGVSLNTFMLSLLSEHYGEKRQLTL